MDILKSILPQTTNELIDEEDEMSPAAAAAESVSDGELRQLFHTWHQGFIARNFDEAVVEHVQKAMLVFSRLVKRQAKIRLFV